MDLDYFMSSQIITSEYLFKSEFEYIYCQLSYIIVLVYTWAATISVLAAGQGYSKEILKSVILYVGVATKKGERGSRLTNKKGNRKRRRQADNQKINRNCRRQADKQKNLQKWFLELPRTPSSS